MPTILQQAVSVTKKWGKSGDPDPNNDHGIYHMRMTNEGKKSIKMKFYVPYNPQTPEQQANRAKFAAGVLAWQGLTLPQKNVYRRRAANKHFSGYNLFLREYMHG